MPMLGGAGRPLFQGINVHAPSQRTTITFVERQSLTARPKLREMRGMVHNAYAE